MALELEGRKVEQGMDRLPDLELQRERMGWKGKHVLQAEEKICVGLHGAGRKVQKTERREARELRLGS